MYQNMLVLTVVGHLSYFLLFSTVVNTGAINVFADTDFHVFLSYFPRMNS